MSRNPEPKPPKLQNSFLVFPEPRARKPKMDRASLRASRAQEAEEPEAAEDHPGRSVYEGIRVLYTKVNK